MFNEIAAQPVEILQGKYDTQRLLQRHRGGHIPIWVGCSQLAVLFMAWTLLGCSQSGHFFEIMRWFKQKTTLWTSFWHVSHQATPGLLTYPNSHFAKSLLKEAMDHPNTYNQHLRSANVSTDRDRDTDTNTNTSTNTDTDNQPTDRPTDQPTNQASKQLAH